MKDSLGGGIRHGHDITDPAASRNSCRAALIA